MNSSNNWQKYGPACKQEDDGVSVPWTIKIWRNWYSDQSIHDFIKHCDTRIITSKLKRPPSKITQNVCHTTTVDSRYLDPSYLDPITYVELISKSRLFSLCIYCISASRMSNYFYVDTSAISSIIFSPWIYFSQFLLPRISNSDHDEGKKM